MCVCEREGMLSSSHRITGSSPSLALPLQKSSHLSLLISREQRACSRGFIPGWYITPSLFLSLPYPSIHANTHTHTHRDNTNTDTAKQATACVLLAVGHFCPFCSSVHSFSNSDSFKIIFYNIAPLNKFHIKRNISLKTHCKHISPDQSSKERESHVNINTAV